MSNSDLSKDAVVIEHIFDAPVNLIWKMWTQPEHFKNWYGPMGASIPVAQMDVRVGGKRLVCMEMQMPDRSMKMWFTGEYREITANKRLVYTESMADEKGNVVSPAAMGMPEGHPEVTEITVLLEDMGGRTKMTMTHAGVPANSGGAGGWQQAFAKMGDYIKAIRSDKS